MATQKALVLTSKGKPMALSSLPIPSPKEDQLLIKTTVCGLNVLDQKVRDLDRFGWYSKLPAVVGSDIVGVVVETSHVLFPVGSRVFSQTLGVVPTAGGLQEHTLVNAAYSAIVPEETSDLDAACWPVNAVTSAKSLFSDEGFGWPFPGTSEAKDGALAGEKLVIVGGGTNVGKMAIQLARLACLGTIITTASLSGEAELRSFGATHVVSRQASDIEDQVREIVGDDLVYVLDCSPAGNHDLAVSLLSTSKKGVFVHVAMGKVDEEIAATKKAGFEDKQVWGWSSTDPEFGRLIWEKLPQLIKAGEIKPLKYSVINGLDAEKINAAFDNIAAWKGTRWHVQM